MNFHNQTDIGLNSRPIPDIIEYIAGEFASVIATIWKDHDLCEYLIAPATTRHVWHAVLSAHNPALPRLDVSRDWLVHSKRKELLRAAFGAYPAGMVGLLAKLDPCAESAKFYRAVHAALDRGDALSRILHHSKTIDHSLILGVALLPTDQIAVQITCYAIRRGIA